MSESPNSLAEVLRSEIARQGPISFRDFMAQALYHPDFGYYTSGRARIGRRGDFFTNVSVGPLFGKLLARQIAEIWERLGGPENFTIVEQGAHRGECAADILTALQTQDADCFAASLYRIVEPAPVLRSAQEEKLTALTAKISWVSSLAELAPFTGVYFSNELLDAFPVHLVAWTDDVWAERRVDFAGGTFRFVNARITDPAMLAALAQIPQPCGEYQTELHLTALDWIAELAPKLIRGGILAIDYGFPRAEYYRPERTAGTLSAYANHRREADPLARPGEIDLTAHVEFTSLVEAAERAGLRLAGLTEQHSFMVGLGQRHFGEGPADPQELRAFKTLMHPELLGQSFKVLALSKGFGETPLSGFAHMRARQHSG